MEKDDMQLAQEGTRKEHRQMKTKSELLASLRSWHSETLEALEEIGLLDCPNHDRVSAIPPVPPGSSNRETDGSSLLGAGRRHCNCGTGGKNE